SREPVPFTVDGLDEPRGRRIVLDLPAQVDDMRVDAPGIERLVGAPDLVEDAVAAHDLAPRLHQEFENGELLGGEIHGPAIPGRGEVLEVDFAGSKAARAERVV